MADYVMRPADVEESELAKADRLAHLKNGADESAWDPRQWDEYFAALDTVHADFTPKAVSTS